MGNQEVKNWEKDVHVIMGFLRKKDNGEETKVRCVRRVVKDEFSLSILEAELLILGGIWRIHQTVNKRSTEKAKNELIKLLLDHPEKASHVDSAWKTILLQPTCKAEKKFMLDVDTKDPSTIQNILKAIESVNGTVLNTFETPNGFHFITLPFDTRVLCDIEEVSVLKDGYHFVKQVGG